MPDYRTTHPGAKAGLSSLRTGVSCVLRAAVICVVACISLLMIPVNVYVSFSGLYIGGNHAFADDGTTGEPPAPTRNYYTYVSEMSQESGLTGGDFVATTIAGLSAATGLNLTQSPGIRLVGNTIGENLSYLADAADYPDWDTLDSATQQNYGSKQNYDSAKYVSLMSAFGLEDGYQRYASGGGTFEFETDEKRQLERIGRIGSNWLGNIGNTIGSIRDLLVPNTDEILYKYLYGTSSGTDNGQEFKGEKPDDWQESYFVYYKLTDVGWVNYLYGNNQVSYYQKVQSLGDVYLIMNRRGQDSFSNFYMFSKAPFNYGYTSGRDVEAEPTLNRSAILDQTVQDRPLYYGNINVTVSNPLVGATQTISHYDGAKILDIEREILYGENSGGGSAGTGELEPDIPDYPTEEIPDTTVIYYPTEGVSPTTTWNNYITVQRPENPFNPDDQTSTPEWKQETKQNIQGLQGVHFEKLFPFCLYYDLDKFWKKVQTICGISTDENGQLNTQDNNNYNEVNLRMYVPNVMDEVWTFNLEPLRDLLLITKPFVLVFLICLEIVSMIMLWKGILTGS